MWVILGLLLAVAQGYTWRNWMGVDGIGYIESALAYTRSDWHWGINTYWSPLYSWVLAVCLKLIPHTMETEFPLVHVVNFFCFVFTFWGFHQFWTELTKSTEQHPSESPVSSLSPKLYNAFGYSLFLYLFVPLVRVVTPDLMASGFVFFICARILNWKRSQRMGVLEASTLGVLVAFAFYAKAILLYFGALAVICALLDRSFSNRVRTGMISGLTALVLIAPWAFAQRDVVGHLSLGSSGRLNYVWFVDGAPAGDFQELGGPPTAFFPSERLSPGIDAFTIETKDHFTYLPWYDPGRIDHSKAHFDESGEIQAVKRNVIWLRIWFLGEYGALVVCLLAFMLIRPKLWMSKIQTYIPLLVPSLAIFAMYSLIFVRSYRYIAATSLILFWAALAAVRLEKSAYRYSSALLLAGLSTFWVFNVPGTLKVILLSPPENHENIAMAQALRADVAPQTRIAAIGIGSGGTAYWAHLAQTPVAGEVWERSAKQFWSLPCDDRQNILSRMKSAGAAVAVGVPPEGLRKEGWQRMEGSEGYILPLNKIPLLNCER